MTYDYTMPDADNLIGTRSVSTLTPSQLARKRANDREAQRAIRARTKEHIERLEREIEELKNRHSRDETVQELLRRNKALEQELAALRETVGLQAPRTYPPTRKSIPHGPLTVEDVMRLVLKSTSVSGDHISNWIWRV